MGERGQNWWCHVSWMDRNHFEGILLGAGKSPAGSSSCTWSPWSVLHYREKEHFWSWHLCSVSRVVPMALAPQLLEIHLPLLARPFTGLPSWASWSSADNLTFFVLSFIPTSFLKLDLCLLEQELSFYCHVPEINMVSVSWISWDIPNDLRNK